MAEYSAAEQFQRIPVVDFVLPSDLTVADRQAQGNVIHRNTSESLRLIENLQLPQTAPIPNVDLKKTSSFQITSVTVSSSISNDGEDDSCGEVDDSQLDPSDVEGNQNTLDVEVFDDTGADSGLSVTSNSNMPLGQQQDTRTEEKDHHITETKHDDKEQVLRRFRVVKIESSEPYTRGRWTCRDYYDQPSVQPNISKEEAGSGASSTGSLPEQHTNREDSHAVQSSVIPTHPANPSPQQVLPISNSTVYDK